MSGNNFGPTIPTFPAPANLRELDLAENLFTGSIAGIGNETALTLLDLANNGTPAIGDSLTTGLTALTNMLALQIVDLSDNQFGGPIGDCVRQQAGADLVEPERQLVQRRDTGLPGEPGQAVDRARPCRQ